MCIPYVYIYIYRACNVLNSIYNRILAKILASVLNYIYCNLVCYFAKIFCDPHRFTSTRFFSQNKCKKQSVFKKKTQIRELDFISI